ncbi:MAG: Bug family tripartite tricarboxylate transporter substrate binding protein [Betaproteobacteria bacterium]
MKRRDFSLGAAAAFAVAQLPLTAHAQAIGTLKMMIPANPGGGWDQTGRTLGAAMQSAKAVQNVQFENKGGAAGAIGLAQFINGAKGDPNAVMMGGMVMVGGIVLNRSAVNLTMVTPLARLTSEYLVVVVPAKSPYKTLAELLAAFRADPGKISWHGGSAGGSDHILAGLIARAAGVDPTKVNYVAAKGGGDAVANIVGGHVTVGISGLGEFAEHIKGGRMRALAVSAPTAQDGIPSLKQLGYEVVLGNWRGIFGAPGITTAQRDALIAAIRAGVDSAAWKETLAKFGWESVFLAGDAFKTFVEEDTQRITGIMARLGLTK